MLPIHYNDMKKRVILIVISCVKETKLENLYVLSPKEERYSMKISSDTSVSPNSTTVSGGPSIVPP